MTTRITGLYSNMDVDALVEAGSSYYQSKLDKAEQKKQKLQWQQDEYKSVVSAVNTFYDKYLDITSDDSLTKSSNWNTNKYTSSNDSAVTATGGQGTALDNYKVSVTQLASAATYKLSDSDSSSNAFKITMYSSTDNANRTVSIDLSGYTNNKDKVTAINSALSSAGCALTATTSDVSGKIALTANTKGSDTSFSIGSDTSGTQYKGNNLHATITSSAGTYTIDDSNNKTTGNTVTLDNIQFNIKNTTTSTTADQYITADSVDNLFQNHISSIDTSNSSGSSGYTLYKLDDTANTVIKIYNNGTVKDFTSGSDAAFSNKAITYSDGTSQTINNNTVATTSSGQVTLTGSRDVSDLQDKIESFVSDYNSLITNINTLYYASHDNDYSPLTDAQKKEMTSTEITNWNTKAQTGLLHGDKYLDSLASEMKESMSTFMYNNNVDIESFGIKAVSDYTTKNGTYSVNSSKLQAALEDEGTFSKLQSLFRDGSDSVTSLSNTCPKSSGILANLKATLNNNIYTANSTFSELCGNDKHASTGTTNELYKELSDQSDLITKYKQELSDKEDALYKKYSELDTKLSQLQSSSSMFSS